MHLEHVSIEESEGQFLEGRTFPLYPEVRTRHSAPLRPPALEYKVCKPGGRGGSLRGTRIANRHITLEWF